MSKPLNLIQPPGILNKTVWQVEPLGDVCEILDHRRKPITKRDRVAGPYPYYGATGVLDHVAGYLFDEPLVLIGEDGAKWDSGDISAFLATGLYWVNNHAHVVRPNRAELMDRWLIYFLNYSDLSEYISGMTVPKLNQGMLRLVPVPFPPIMEQERIVAILDAAIEGIETAKTTANKNKANAFELFESRVAEIFTARGDGWQQQKLEDVCQDITVGHVGSMSKEYQADGVPFLRSQNVRPFHISLENVVYINEVFNDSLKKSQLRPGDLAIVRTGYPGTAAVIPADLPLSNCSDLVIVRPGPRLNPYYMAHFFNSTHGKRLVLGNIVGSAQKHFNIGSAKNVLVPVPSLTQQERVVAMLDEFRQETQRLETAHTQKLQSLETLKQSLLHQAFSGNL